MARYGGRKRTEALLVAPSGPPPLVETGSGVDCGRGAEVIMLYVRLVQLGRGLCLEISFKVVAASQAASLDVQKISAELSITKWG